MRDYTQVHADAKAEAERIAEHTAATKGGPYIAAEKIMARRKTKGLQSALVAALAITALYERGHPDAAAQLTKELALMADERL
ncbi:hypothetical protein [Pseudomonas aeruginosa]|uniref:hypothetical protein n=1 Tax=Pseudomonas aeruginosa TaxID=287 RepID=UPI0029C9DCE9|nr:hypothetical protein [Pseudomonas aeruginosa]